VRTLRDVWAWYLDNTDFDPAWPAALDVDTQREMAADICEAEPDFLRDAFCEQTFKHSWAFNEIVSAMRENDAVTLGAIFTKLIRGYFFIEESGLRWLSVEAGIVQDQETEYEND